MEPPAGGIDKTRTTDPHSPEYRVVPDNGRQFGCNPLEGGGRPLARECRNQSAREDPLVAPDRRDLNIRPADVDSDNYVFFQYNPIL